MPIKNRTANLVKVVASERFFWAIAALLVIQAGWIALTGRYPMAFDEDFHLGIIRLYAHHISPFWSSQPVGADVFGAVARDPSYLYQYLMSFPYRLISVFTHDQTIQVIILRFFDIGLFSSSLVFFRRLLLKTGASRTIVHLSLLLFVLVPVVPLLAAQINYDDLLVPLTGLSLLLTLRLADQIRARQFSLSLVLGLASLCLLTSLVKYAFLPIFAAILFYLGIILYRTFKPRGWRQLSRAWRQSWRALPKGSAAVLLLLLALSGVLFTERYGINLVRYQAPVPDCGKVLSVEQCSAYGPWIRDYNYKINRVDEERDPFVFTGDWLKGMWIRLFFAVDGPGTQFQTRGPLLLPAVSSIGFVVFGIILFIKYARHFWRRYDGQVLWLFSLVIGLYTAALWLDEYRAYLQTGQPVAINGRYLFPVMLMVILMLGLAYRECLRSQQARWLLGGLIVIGLAWGGGALTYILRSNDNWYWNSQPVRDVNHAVQNSLGPAVPGYYNSIEFL